MRYKPNDCKMCGGSKKMDYGGIVDYFDKIGVRSDFDVRESIFYDLYGTKEKYTGSAKQNIKFLKDVQKVNLNDPHTVDERGNIMKGVSSGAAAVKYQGRQQANPSVSNPIPTPKPSASSRKPMWYDNNYSVNKSLESGVVVDKRTGKAYVINNHQSVKEFPVLTGKNIEGNVGSYKRINQMTDVDKVTPIGYYSMNKNSVSKGDKQSYENNIMALEPISAFGQPKPNVSNLAVHQTHNPAERNKYYGTSSPYISYGCVNCKKPDAVNLMNRFPTGDTLNVVDSNTPQGSAALRKYGIKRLGGDLGEPCYDDAGNVIECPPEMSDNGTQYFQTGYTDNGGGLKQSTGYNPENYPYAGSAKAEQFSTTNPITQSKTTTVSKKIDPYFAMLGVQNGLSWLSNLKDRKRQDQYRYNQMSTLGQMNPMPVENFQPNAYNLYSKYGGNLSRIKNSFNHGGNIMMASYHNLPKDEYDAIYQQMYGQEGYHKMPDGTLMKNSEMQGYMDEGGNWIPKNLKKGRCTPGSPNYDCPPGSPQYNLSQTFKKHHGFH